MTITTPINQDAGKDRGTDTRVDVQTDAGRAGGKDERAGAGGFVIVLANHKGGVTKTTSTANLGDVRRGRSAGADRRLRPAGKPV